MNDTILLAEGEMSLRGQVAEALKLYREGDLLALSMLPLAHTSLVQSGLLTGEPATSDMRGRAMQSLLHWAVDRLRPGGAHSWLLPAWRTYNVLHHFYLHNMRASDLAEAMSVAEQTLYQWRPQAIAALTQVIGEELASPRDLLARKRYALADRYARHTAAEQQLLRLAAVFPHSIPTELLHQLAETFAVGEVAATLHALAAANLLISSDEGDKVVIHPEMRPYLLTLLPTDLRQSLHSVAGAYYQSQGDHLEAARQLRAASHWEQAAALLIEQQRSIVDNLQIEELGELVGQFRSTEVSASTWAKLKLVAGEVAELTRDLDAALLEYQQALNAPDVYTKANAYYLRAKVFGHKNIDEALAHYAYAIQLVEEERQRTSAPDGRTDALLVRMYIQRAWIFIQVRPDLARAASDLHQAQALIDRSDRRLWCDLYTVLGEYHHYRRDPSVSIEHYWQAWLAANEVRDAERMSQAAHNLGLVYMDDLRQYDQALAYLQRSQELACQTGNRQMEGLCSMSRGACYFWLQQLPLALTAYQGAAGLFAETGNRTLLTRTHYGLAEAHAALGDLPQAHEHLQAGLAIANELGDAGALADFAQLTRDYPQLVRPMDAASERQQKALAYMQQHGQITNRAYQELTGVSQKQSVRDLNEMVAQGILVRVGSGRATAYRRPKSDRRVENVYA
jgi:tetratricopeptide (TPR) repeat protein